jgi:type VI secretion system Hcp family effector
MKIKGVTGSATESGHTGWIELSSVNFLSKRGNQQNNEGTKPYIGEFQIVKLSDQSSPLLFQKLLQGQTIPEITIDFCHTAKEAKVQRQYILENVLINHYEETSSTAHDTQSHAMEYITLQAARIEKTHIFYDATGRQIQPTTVGYDLTMARVM